MEVRGLTLESFSSGFARETDMKDMDMSIPMAVIWVSPYLTCIGE